MVAVFKATLVSNTVLQAPMRVTLDCWPDVSATCLSGSKFEILGSDRVGSVRSNSAEGFVFAQCE